MANELKYEAPVTGTYYANVQQGANVWTGSGSTMGAISAANKISGAIALTRQGTTLTYLGNFPALPSGEYQIEVYAQAGGSPAAGDIAVGEGDTSWSGTALVPRSTMTPDTLLDQAAGVETGLTFRQWLRLAASVMFGKSANGGATYRDIGDTKNRITATVDGSNNRTAVTRDAT